MKLPIRNIILLVLMLSASALSVAMKPGQRQPSDTDKVNLELMIPSAFGAWSTEPQTGALVVNPSETEVLDQIYAATLSRTYVNTQGKRVMLSIAYGVEQNKQSQVHRPDVCYPAQGFKVQSEGQTKLKTPYATIPVLRLIATQGNRIEPISYWIRVGDDLASGWVGQKIAVVKQGLRGNVADGLLFRVSSIDADAENAFPIQEQFIKDLLATVSESDRPFLVGRP